VIRSKTVLSAASMPTNHESLVTNHALVQSAAAHFTTFSLARPAAFFTGAGGGASGGCPGVAGGPSVSSPKIIPWPVSRA
jgi:hypothetical protein